MKTLIILLGFTLIFSLVTLAQTSPQYQTENGINIQNLKADGDFDNIKVQKLASDSLSSSFLIWIKEGVALHKHEVHTENVYILEGEGTMTLGEKTFHISTGSYIFIPANTTHSVVVDKSQGVMKVLSIQSPNFDGTDRVLVVPSNSPKGGGQ